MSLYEAVSITPNVYWVGVVDWELRDFHGYETRRGSTYNAYLIVGSQGGILIDGVKHGFEEQCLSRIRSIIDPAKIKVVISNHSEMDHSGTLPDMMQHFAPDAVLYASPMGVKALAAHFHWDREVKPLKTGDTLDVCGEHLTFVETRMLHWPDSMFTYYQKDKILFTNDAFGMHLAGEERFAKQYDRSVLFEEARKYYANILTPYSMQVGKLLKSYPSLGIDATTIAPDHGPIWQGEQELTDIFSWYERWSSNRVNSQIIIAYGTMWGSTRRMANAISEGIRHCGVRCLVFPLGCTHRSDIAALLLESSGLVLGSPTLNLEVLPEVAAAITYFKGLKFKPLVTGAFGSYGWAPKSIMSLEKSLDEMKCPALAPGIKVQYVPTEDDLEQCKMLGISLAKKLIELKENEQ